MIIRTKASTRTKSRLEQELAVAMEQQDIHTAVSVARRIGQHGGRMLERSQHNSRNKDLYWKGYQEGSAKAWETMTSGNALDALQDVTAALETVMAHYGDTMPEADQRGRQSLIERAHGILAKAEEV